MHGTNGDANLGDIHTERTIVKEMEVACSDLEDEVTSIQEEVAAILASLKTSVGDLSDLRYGKFAKKPGSTEEFGDEVIQGIRRVQEVCDGL